MAQSIRHRRGSAAPRNARPQPEANSAADPGAAVADHMEGIVPWYHRRVLDALDSERASKMDDAELADAVGGIVRRLELTPNAPPVSGGHANLAVRLVDEMRGLGPIGPLLRDPDVSDILVNGPQSVYIERAGQLCQTNVRFQDADHITRIAQRVAERVGRRIDELSPLCDARLEDGSRVNIIGPPLAIDGAAISIRRFKKGGFTLQQLATLGAMHPNMAALMEVATKAQLNIVVTGGTGSGKTTLLNALSGHINVNERVVTLEDAAELHLRQPHVVRLETRVASSENAKEISMRDLLKNALRMRPDRIIVGEVRGAEALEALQAMNTGHPGSMFTVHANTPRDTLSRLEYLVMMGAGDIPMTVIRNQVISAVDLIIQAARFRDGKRRIVCITDVVGLEGDKPVLEDLWAYDTGTDSFVCSRSNPSFARRVEDQGFGDQLKFAMNKGRNALSRTMNGGPQP
ncbi:MAG: CpaF family protein [Gammaproteobacteria bacterium]|nr:CpaF family protein [Gammaproteobacteria bacterium]